MDWECECSEDYGPCEDHSEFLGNREGASCRTADELARVFIDDAVALGVVLTADDEADLVVIDREFEKGSWLYGDEDGYPNNQRLYDLKESVESRLYEVVEGISIVWEDGYVMSKMLPGCPLNEV